jgi:probable HAF family extracellular repeat protein
MLRTGKLILALLLLAQPWSGAATDKTVLIEFDPKADAQPLGVSAGGAVVVGGLTTGGGFYWMPTTGVIYAGGLFATNVSRDGKVIVGQAVDARLRQAAIWQRGTEWRALGSFPNALPCDTFLSKANNTSRDGKVVVGYANNGCPVSHAFRWEEATGMVDLGSSVAGQDTQAIGVSADGQVAVGYQQQEGGFTEGAKWVGTKQERVPGQDGYVGTANATNVDGSIVVGRICRPTSDELGEPDFQSAWVWTPDGTQCLPAPKLRASPGPLIIVEANATSDDGRVIGGGQAVASSPDSDAIIWINRRPAYLKDFLQVNGVPSAFATWVNTGAIRGVSPDGRVLVGTGAALGGFQGYIVVLGTNLVMP